MLPEVSKSLYDVVRAADKVARFIQAASEADYCADELLQSAVERQLFIVGEALIQAAKFDPLLETQLGDLPRIRRLRNLLAHAYFKVRHEVIWEIASQDLPVLKREIEALLGPNSAP